MSSVLTRYQLGLLFQPGSVTAPASAFTLHGTTRHVELTPHGRELLAVIERSLEELDGAIATIARSAKGTQRQISLGTTPLVAANIWPPAMREFRKQRPDVRIQLFDAKLPTLIKMVEAGQLDMSVGIFKAMPDMRRATLKIA